MMGYDWFLSPEWYERVFLHCYSEWAILRRRYKPSGLLRQIDQKTGSTGTPNSLLSSNLAFYLTRRLLILPDVRISSTLSSGHPLFLIQYFLSSSDVCLNFKSPFKSGTLVETSLKLSKCAGTTAQFNPPGGYGCTEDPLPLSTTCTDNVDTLDQVICPVQPTSSSTPARSVQLMMASVGIALVM